MRLSTKCRNGTRMLLDIAEHGCSGPVPMAGISQRTGISAKNLEKLVQRFKTAGLVVSRRGPKGGHMLSRPARRITLGDIARALEEPADSTGCVPSPAACARCPQGGACPAKGAWKKAGATLFAALDAHTLHSLLKYRS